MEEKPGSSATVNASETTITAESQDPSSHETTPATTDSSSKMPDSKAADPKSPKAIKASRKSRRNVRRQKAKKPPSRSSSISSSAEDDSSDAEDSSTSSASIQPKQKKTKSSKSRSTKSKTSKPKKDPSSNESESDSNDSESESDSTSSSSQEEPPPRKAKTRKTAKTGKPTTATKSKAKHVSSDSSDDSEPKKKKKKRSKFKPKKHSKTSRSRQEEFSSDSSTADVGVDNPIRTKNQWSILQFRGVKLSKLLADRNKEREEQKDSVSSKPTPQADEAEPAKAGSKMDFVRIDRRWENWNWVTRLTGQSGEAAEYDQYVFKVRREFDYNGKVDETLLDIKSEPLRKVLVKVMGNVKCITLSGDTPSVPPNIVFCFHEELRSHLKQLKSKMKSQKKRRVKKRLKAQSDALKILLKYIDDDYKDAKKKLSPMLEEGKITFDLLWTLFKPNSIIYAPTYEADNVPRAFKVDSAYRLKSILKGDYWLIEGQYLDHDGKKFGLADIVLVIESYKGPRKISDLPCYPIQYHMNREKLEKDLIARGKRFTQMNGMQFKHHRGMAFYKKPHHIIRLNVDGRVMVDPLNFRRINPNYHVSSVKPEDPDLLSDSEDDTDEAYSSTESDDDQFDQIDVKKTRKKVVHDPISKTDVVVRIEVEEKGNAMKGSQTDDFDDNKFTKEDFLIASPVVLGFSFSHKQWVEFDVAGLSEINFAEDAYDSLVLPGDQKEVVRALVESHSRKEGKNISDIIQGKGEGLVTVLHGPPGCGKTLTAESIAEVLKKPLYMVSVGELGTRGGDLERSFSQIIDIAHCWGAILLLDEADIFLEKRSLYDIGRNALVSIFLRLLEYFKGIVFLTTNRVVTFDEAFQSRIHIGLRYGELNIKAKKEVWKMFIEKVRALNNTSTQLSPSGTDSDKKTDQGSSSGVQELTEQDYTKLAQYEMNGREIKNSVRTAQSLAIIDKKPLGMEHLLKVLFVGNVFAKDLKGPGYEEALKFYM